MSSHLARFILLLCLLAAAACQPVAAPATEPVAVATVIPTTEPPAAEASPTPVPTPTLAGPYYVNPVYPNDFPDPHILRVEDVYYGYSTNAANANIQLIRSTDLANWERIGDALPALPLWAAVGENLTWAPGVIRIGDTFVLYFTARYQAIGRQCISRAVSQSPEGPFADDSEEPFVCQQELGGSIDPYPFQDHDGQLYLLWKNDGNCCGMEVALWVAPLTEDGLSLAGEPVKLLVQDQAWERPLIENPAMVLVDGDYFLFYSGNWWASHEYAVGYSVCESITGPCDKPLSEPVFQWKGDAMGPGGQAFFTGVDGNLWMAYHAWTGIDIGYPAGERSLRIEPVEFVDGKPIIEGPTLDPQPFP
jgi:beta-xylosidase